jgi:hypothetical protein
MESGLRLSILILSSSFVLSIGASAQTYSLPNDDAGCPGTCRAIPWKAGSDIWNGGTLPNYTPITCNGLAANGTIGATTGTNDGPAIQTCLNNVSSGQCAVIPAGTYFVNTLLTIPSNKCLRGAEGLGKPFLPSVNATKTTFVLGTAAGIQANTGHSVGAQRTIASGYTKGSTVLVMAAGHGFAVNNWITISETPDTGIGVTKTGIDGACNWCGQDDSNGATGVYLMNQMVQVTAVNGNNVTISRPLYYTFQSTFGPVARTLGVGTTKGGIENIRLDGSAADRGRPFIDYENAAFMWVKGVETYMAGSAAKDGHLTMSWSYGNEIRDSYFHHGRNYGSDRDYGIYSFLVNSDHKVENNIVRLSRHPIAQEGGGSGTVYLYNFTDDAQEDDPSYMAGGALNHGAHPYMNLLEGNVFSHIYADDYWGSSSHNVYFRNWMWGDETQTSDIGTKPSEGYWPLEAWRDQNYYSFVGNVLGITGKWGNPNWSTYTLINSSCATDPNIYQLGCNPFNNQYNSLANSSRILHGNYDLKTHGVAFWDGGSNHSLAASIYYVSQPTAWWKVGSYVSPWPGIGPDQTGGLAEADGVANKNPAQACFESGGTVCFSAATGGVPNIQISPPSLNFSTQRVNSTASQTVTLTNTGTADLHISSVTPSGIYTAANDCSTVVPSAFCTVTVTFAPLATGSFSGAISIVNDAAGSPQSASLAGIGTVNRVIGSQHSIGGGRKVN